MYTASSSFLLFFFGWFAVPETKENTYIYIFNWDLRPWLMDVACAVRTSSGTHVKHHQSFDRLEWSASLISTNGPYEFRSHFTSNDARPNDLTRLEFYCFSFFSLSLFLSVFSSYFSSNLKMNTTNKCLSLAEENDLCGIQYWCAHEQCRLLPTLSHSIMFTMWVSERPGARVWKCSMARRKEISYWHKMHWSGFISMRFECFQIFYWFFFRSAACAISRTNRERIYWWLSLEIIKFEWMCVICFLSLFSSCLSIVPFFSPLKWMVNDGYQLE